MKIVRLAWVFLFLIQCNENSGSSSTLSSGCGKFQNDGTFEKEIQVGDNPRVYKMIVPSAYDPKIGYSLVFGYHGSAYSNTPDTMISLTTTMRGASDDQAIFVYPDGHINGVPNYWDKSGDGIDVTFFDKLLENLEKNYCIDTSKVFVVGFSDGGGMANTLGCHRSFKIRAVAEASGYLPQKEKCGDSPMPFFIWHGRSDTITSFDSYAQPEIDHWKTVNGCTNETTNVGPASEECVMYTCSKATLTTCTPNADHGFPAIIGETIWNFF